jgi:hypothetical protein
MPVHSGGSSLVSMPWMPANLQLPMMLTVPNTPLGMSQLRLMVG